MDQAPTPLLRVQGIEVVDSTGAPRVTIGTIGDDQVILQMNDRAGEAGIQVGLQEVRMPDGTTVTVPVVIAGSSTGAQANLIAGPDGSISFTLISTPEEAGHAAAAIAVDSNGTPRIRLLDSNNHPLWEIP